MRKLCHKMMPTEIDIYSYLVNLGVIDLLVNEDEAPHYRIHTKDYTHYLPFWRIRQSS